MVSATKNKRGRPKIFTDHVYTIMFDCEKRVAQNLMYAMEGYKIIHPDHTIYTDPDSYDPFWLTKKGKFKKQGILEQIGRMYSQDGYTEDECKDIFQKVIVLIENGYSVKDVEKMIRHGRTTGEW